MNETLLYIILGVLYLIFTALGRASKKKQKTTNREEQWSLEDALRDLQGLPEEQPEVAPAPAPSSDRSGEYNVYTTEMESSSAKAPEQKYTAPPPVTVRKPSPPSKPETAASLPRKKPSVTIAEQLRNQDSARTAILLGEILGRPKGLGGLPQSHFQRRG